MFKSQNIKSFIIFSLLLILSCASGPEVIYQDPSFNKPIEIAVLPFANNTSDLKAGYLIRELFALGLKEKKYTVMDIEEIDKRLNEIGITDGGQLNAVSIAEMNTVNQIKILIQADTWTSSDIDFKIGDFNITLGSY